MSTLALAWYTFLVYNNSVDTGAGKLDIYNVVIDEHVLKSLSKLPKHIVIKLQAWIDGVSEDGLREMRKISGYHDEPLHGKRSGQRSIRLSKAYRAIYQIDSKGNIAFVEIIEVNKHEY